MIRELTIGCDWPDCQATLTYAFRLLRPDAPGWKTESDGFYSLHLCPAHSRKTWMQVREAQAFRGHDAPSTSHGAGGSS